MKISSVLAAISLICEAFMLVAGAIECWQDAFAASAMFFALACYLHVSRR